MVGGGPDGGALYGDGPRGIGGGMANPGTVGGDCVVAGGAYALNGVGGLEDTEDALAGPTGGDVIRGGGATPFGGGGGGALCPPTGGPTGGEPGDTTGGC